MRVYVVKLHNTKLGLLSCSPLKNRERMRFSVKHPLIQRDLLFIKKKQVKVFEGFSKEETTVRKKGVTMAQL